MFLKSLKYIWKYILVSVKYTFWFLCFIVFFLFIIFFIILLALLCLILYKVNILLLELFGISLFDYLFGVSLGCLFDVNLFGVSLDCLFDINLDYFFDINFFIV
jgi:hypothetical protein